MLCEQWGEKKVDFRHIGMKSKNETQVGMHGVTGTEVAKEVGTCFDCIKAEEVKRGICIPPEPTGAPWCDCVWKLVHVLSELCLLLGDAKLVSSGCLASSSYTVWRGTGWRRKKREKCPPFM